ncbi:MAG: hypothetical protein LAN37_05545 [Acidobacteriia bacterium]|nr:hypothetical protein [Terriglobia bacterium]
MRLALILLITSLGNAACLPFTEAPKKLGSTVCITGKVLSVKQSPSGAAWFLNFCEERRNCPFAAVVFTRDLRDVGDVRMLAGRTIEVHGRVLEYKGVPEIIIRDARQLKGEAAKLPPVPKEFDVSRKGRYSPGQTRTKRSTTSTDIEQR